MMPKTDATGKTTLVKIGRPVSAANEHELRKKMQNRASAIEARLKKKRKMDELEKKVQELTAENEKLRFDNAKLQCKG
jgi:regulator of replication initiation timing